MMCCARSDACLILNNAKIWVVLIVEIVPTCSKVGVVRCICEITSNIMAIGDVSKSWGRAVVRPTIRLYNFRSEIGHRISTYEAAILYVIFKCIVFIISVREL